MRSNHSRRPRRRPRHQRLYPRLRPSGLRCSPIRTTARILKRAIALAYPDAWYSNAAVPNPFNPAGEGFPACRLFAPTDFVVVYGTEIPSDVAIWINVDELAEGTDWNYEPLQGNRILTDSETEVAGQPGRVQEIEATERSIALRPGDRYTMYVVELSGNRYLVAQTYSQQDYDTSRLILEQMMETVEFASP